MKAYAWSHETRNNLSNLYVSINDAYSELAHLVQFIFFLNSISASQMARANIEIAWYKAKTP